eukprot:104929-Prymnesium_polylepis.2
MHVLQVRAGLPASCLLATVPRSDTLSRLRVALALEWNAHIGFEGWSTWVDRPAAPAARDWKVVRCKYHCALGTDHRGTALSLRRRGEVDKSTESVQHTRAHRSISEEYERLCTVCDARRAAALPLAFAVRFSMVGPAFGSALRSGREVPTRGTHIYISVQRLEVVPHSLPVYHARELLEQPVSYTHLRAHETLMNL